MVIHGGNWKELGILMQKYMYLEFAQMMSTSGTEGGQPFCVQYLCG